MSDDRRLQAELYAEALRLGLSPVRLDRPDERLTGDQFDVVETDPGTDNPKQVLDPPPPKREEDGNVTAAAFTPTEVSYEDKLTKARARRKQLRQKVIRAMLELEKCNGYIGWLDAKLAAERGDND